MNKENSLYGIIGLLIGLIIGYAGTNSLNSSVPATQSNSTAASQSGQSESLPPNHPQTGQSANDSSGGGAQGEVMAAIEQARKDPSNFDAQMKAADLFKQINRPEGELEFYERAAKVKPNDPNLLARMTQALIDKGDKTAAAATLKRLEQSNPKNPALAQLRSQLP